MSNSEEKATLAILCMGIIWLGLLAAGAYVVVHFIVKWW